MYGCVSKCIAPARTPDAAASSEEDALLAEYRAGLPQYMDDFNHFAILLEDDVGQLDDALRPQCKSALSVPLREMIGKLCPDDCRLSDARPGHVCAADAAPCYKWKPE